MTTIPEGAPGGEPEGSTAAAASAASAASSEEAVLQAAASVLEQAAPEAEGSMEAEIGRASCRERVSLTV